MTVVLSPLGYRTCSIEGCGQRHLARTWCAKHYGHWRATGFPVTPRVCETCGKALDRNRTSYCSFRCSRNSARAKAYQRSYRVANPEKSRAHATRYAEKYPERIRMRRWSARIEKVYGTGADEWYRDQLVGQAGRCAICPKVLPPLHGTCVDHDHATGKVRGLLCRACNLLLGNARDDVRILQGAIRYLELSA